MPYSIQLFRKCKKSRIPYFMIDKGKRAVFATKKKALIEGKRWALAHPGDGYAIIKMPWKAKPAGWRKLQEQVL